MRTPEVLLIGGPHSGKTHFAGQLYGRILRGSGKLKRATHHATPGDLTILQEVLNALEEGRAASHTPASTSGEICLPMEDAAGHHLVLKWPDYGGEQITGILENRAVPEAWQSRLDQVEGWALIIRLSDESSVDARPTLPHAPPSDVTKQSPVLVKAWDPNARWVELMQILLHVAEQDTSRALQLPRLVVLLSCYDECPSPSQAPADLLAARLPMLHSFLSTTWAEDAWSVWGLSALGRTLNADQFDETFLTEGPDQQGWVVAPQGGNRDPDLTAPLAWLLGRL